MSEQLSQPTPSPNGTGRGHPLRIVAADPDPAMCRVYQEVLPALGHQVQVARCGRGAVELCRAGEADLLITDLKLPDQGGLEAAVEVSRDRPTPVIVVSDLDDPEVISRAPDALVFAYLVKPLRANALGPAITVAMHCFGRLKSLWAEVADLRQALEDRKVIERAKGMVMRYAGLDEEEAFSRLRRLASVQNRKLAEVAQAVITAAEVFQLLDQAGEGGKPGDVPAKPLRRGRLHRNGPDRPAARREAHGAG